MIEWLVVDLGGVAASYHPDRRLDALTRATGLAGDLIHQQLFASGFDHRAELGDFSHDDILDAVRSRLGVSISERELVASWSLAFEPDRQVLELVASQSARTCLFTNNGPLIDHCFAGPLSDLAQIFNTVICSFRLNVTKPNPAAFTLAAQRLGAPPDSLLFVDDSPSNIAAAAQQGWLVHHFVGHDELRTTLVEYGLLH
jgi:glucose-1-phosphatase